MCTNFQVITERYITENTSEIVIHAFSSTPTLSWVSVNVLVETSNSKMINVIDAIAPTKVKVSLIRKDLHGELP